MHCLKKIYRVMFLSCSDAVVRLLLLITLRLTSNKLLSEITNIYY